MQQITLSIKKLNDISSIEELKPLSHSDLALLEFNIFFPDNISLTTLRDLVNKIKDTVLRKDDLIYTLEILDIPSNRDKLWETRGLNNTLSGFQMGASAAGVGTAGAALAGVSVIPVIGWTVAALTLGGLAAKFAVE